MEKQTKKLSAPSAKGLGGAMRRAALMLLLAVFSVVSASAQPYPDGYSTYTLATDRKSMTVTVGSGDVTVNATLGTTQGSCGDNATWSLADNDNNGTYETLIISGTGTVQDYSQANPAPWGNAITFVTVGNGITGIGDYAFANCSSLQRVDINYNDAVSIGSNTFSGCTALQYIVFPSPANALAHTTGNWAPYQAKIRA